MAKSYPYISSSGPIVQAVTHLRKTFPSKLDADTLRKLGIAPKNESYLINIFRFIGIIDEEGKKSDKAAKVFSQHEDAAFKKAFGEIVKSAYSGLFSLHSDAWTLSSDALITFFRQTDDSSAIVGGRQANTFRALSALSGHGDIPQPKANAKGSQSGKRVTSGKVSAKVTKSKLTPPEAERASSESRSQVPLKNLSPNVGLTVRVEVNLPADATQEAYDRIFQSIRKNLIDAS